MAHREISRANLVLLVGNPKKLAKVARAAGPVTRPVSRIALKTTAPHRGPLRVRKPI